MNQPLWSPDPARIERAQITRFQAQLNAQGHAAGSDYPQFYRWSVENPELFWSSLWDYSGVVAEGEREPVLADGDKFPGARWFPATRLNFAENLLRYRDEQVALVSLLENGERRELSYAGLYCKVAQLAVTLRQRGVVAGDRVAGFMPNIEETVVAMLAATQQETQPSPPAVILTREPVEWAAAVVRERVSLRRVKAPVIIKNRVRAFRLHT